jgi:hypothetical protein
MSLKSLFMREDINSILLANLYLTMCRLSVGSHSCKKTELARKYLLCKIKKALFERNKSKILSNKALPEFKLVK